MGFCHPRGRTLIWMLLSKLEYGALLSYTPKPQTEDEKASRTLMYRLKTDSVSKIGAAEPLPFSLYIAKHIARKISALPFSDFFGPKTTLVPVPKSSLLKQGILWVPQRLAEAFVKEGLGGKAVEYLKRKEALPKAAFQIDSKNRPMPEDHYRTLQVEKTFDVPNSIVLIDDVVTTGSALLGSASRLAEIFPGTNISAFAAMRTISDPNGFRSIEDPCRGTVILRPNGTAARGP